MIAKLDGKREQESRKRGNSEMWDRTQLNREAGRKGKKEEILSVGRVMNLNFFGRLPT